MSTKKTYQLKHTFEDTLIDVNAKVAIAFGITIIAFLLVYIAFFK